MSVPWSLWVAVALAVPVAPVDEGAPEPIEGVTPDSTAPADVEAVARQIGLGLRCPVCQGLSAADSTSPAAVNMQRRIRELVAQGYSRAQIEAYFVSRYGEWVLLAPTGEGLNQVVWIGPAAALVVALGAALMVVGRRREDDAPSTPVADLPGPTTEQTDSPRGDSGSTEVSS